MTAQTPPATPPAGDGDSGIETIIELVETINPWLLVAAFIVGALVVAGVVAYLGRENTSE